MNECLRILIVEDNPADADLIGEMLPDSGFTIETVPRLADALARLEGRAIDVVLLDLGLPDSQGLDTFISLHRAVPDCPIIVLTGNTDQETALTAVREGAQDFLVKGQISGNTIERATRYAVERKRAASELLESERRLKEAQKMAHIGHWRWDVRTGDVVWSEEVYRIFGLEPNAFTPHIDSILAFSPWPEDHERDKELIRRAMDNHEMGFYDQRILRPDGSIGYYHSTFQGEYDEEGNLIVIIGTAQDVTDRKRAEEATIRAHDRLRRFIDANIIGVVIATPSGGILETNDYYLDMIGYTREEFERGLVDWRTMTPPEWLTADEQAVQELRQRGTCTPYEKEYVRRDGTRVSVLLSDAMLPGHEEQIAAFALDITDRKRAEAAVRALSARQEAILDAVHDIIMEVDADKIYTWANQAGLEFFGDDVIGREAAYYFEGEQRTYQMVQPLFNGNQDVLYVESWQRRKDGRKRLLAWWCRVLKDERGNVTGALSSGRDITEWHQAAEELRLKNTELERFTYTISHDLRTPLVTFKTFLGYLEEDRLQADDGRIEKDLFYLRGAANKMGELLDELLEMSRVGRVVNPSVRVTFRELADEAMDVVAGAIAERGVAVEVSDQPFTLFGDRRRLAEIWQNLIENGVKFMGDQSSPRIEIGLEPAGPETVFFVRDNGIGIDPHYHAKVFGLFERLDPKIEGTGLGLALVKRIVELYGGTIGIESKGAGHGSSFRFTLPHAYVNRPPGETS